MIEWTGFLVALGALGGWSYFLVKIGMSMQAQATGLKVLGEFDARFDDRISAAIARLRPTRNAESENVPRGTTVLDDANELMREAKRKSMLGDMPPMANDAERYSVMD